jgi:hypothetical protein
MPLIFAFMASIPVIMIVLWLTDFMLGVSGVQGTPNKRKTGKSEQPSDGSASTAGWAWEYEEDKNSPEQQRSGLLNSYSKDTLS